MTVTDEDFIDLHEFDELKEKLIGKTLILESNSIFDLDFESNSKKLTNPSIYLIIDLHYNSLFITFFVYCLKQKKKFNIESFTKKRS